MRAEICDRVRHYLAVGNCDVLITRRHNSGYEQRLLGDLPVHPFNLDDIANLECPCIGQQDSRQQVSNQPAAAEGHQGTDKYRKTAKECRVGAGQVREAHHQNEHKQKRTAELVSGIGPVRGKVFEHDGSVLNGVEQVLQSLEENPTEHQYHKQVTEVGDVVLYRLGCVVQRRLQNLTESVRKDLSARKVRKAEKEISQKQRSGHQVTEQEEAKSNDSAGMKSGIGFQRLAAGAQPGLPRIDALVGEPVHLTHDVDRKQQERTGNQCVVDADQHATEPAQLRFRAQPADGASQRGQEPLGRLSQKKK